MITIAILLAAAPQAPTYLQCSFAKGPAALDVTADEANGQVTTLVQATGHMERRSAIFSPTAVKWSVPGSLDLSYNLSRVDLSLQRHMSIGDDTGSCRIQDTPKRAF